MSEWFADLPDGSANDFRLLCNGLLKLLLADQLFVFVRADAVWGHDARVRDEQ